MAYLKQVKGELPIHDLCRDLNLTFEEVSMAIGWLARENKIILTRTSNMLFASIVNTIEFSFG